MAIHMAYLAIKQNYRNNLNYFKFLSQKINFEYAMLIKEYFSM